MIGFPFAKNNFSVSPITTDDSALLHDIHRHSFLHVWDEDTFSGFLLDRQVFGYLLRLVGQPNRILGFVLCRLIVDEAEIITIAVHPNFRGRGVGQRLMDAVLRHLHHERATALFLEVDESNGSALQLYKRFGFVEVGRRPAYYETSVGRSDALIMRRSFQQKD